MDDRERSNPISAVQSSQPDAGESSSADPPSQTRPRGASASTVASRRQSAYDHQRISRAAPRPQSTTSSQVPLTQQQAAMENNRSRPVSSASRSSKARSKRYSSQQQYQLADEFNQLDQAPALPSPLYSHGERPSDVSYRDQAHMSYPARNFSKRDPEHGRSHSQTTTIASRAPIMKETTALPPVPSSAGYSGGMDGAGSKEAELGRTKSRGTAASGAFIPPTDEEWMKNQLPASPPFRNSLYTISYLIFFSIWGTLLRLAIQWITFYPGTPLVTPVAWANLGGSFLMGFLLDDHITFRDIARAQLYAEKPQNWEDHNDKDELATQKKRTPLFIGLTVGFCGCLTSFSSFARDIFLALSNDLPTPNNHPFDTAPRPTYAAARNGGYSVTAVLAVILTTLALSLGGLLAGGHLADALSPRLPSLPPRLLRRILNPLILLLGWGCWLGALLLAIFPPSARWRGEVLFALVFAPAGALLRYYASTGLNGLVVTFPLGTFAVNMFGTAVEGMAYDVQHVGVGIMGLPGGGRIGCQVLQGVMDGFCGGLTTVSTLIAEIKSLRRRRDGYVYAGVSAVGGLALMVVIMGSVKWTVGFGQTGCETGYTSKVS